MKSFQIILLGEKVLPNNTADLEYYLTIPEVESHLNQYRTLNKWRFPKKGLSNGGFFVYICV